MASAAEAAAEAVGSAGADAGAAAAPQQVDTAGAPGGEAAAAEPQATSKPPISETVRMARELRRTQAKLAELEKRGAPAPVQQHAENSREAVLADLKRRYEEDPEGLIRDLAGEDFYAMAKRVDSRNAAPETKIQALERELAELKGTTSGLAKARETEAQKAADAVTQQHIANMAKEIEATDADGNPKYPTLATLDPDVLEEPVAMTAYNAVAFAWDAECRRLDPATGKRVQFKEWSEPEIKARFERAFTRLERHFAKLRTPRGRTPEPQHPQRPDDVAHTISTSTSSGLAERPQKPASGTLPWDQALRMALREQGLS